MTETPTHTPLPCPNMERVLADHLREVSKVIVDHLGGGSEWFARIGDDFYVDPKAIGPELHRRKTDAQIAKKALFRANTRADSHHRLVEALEAFVNCARYTPHMDGTSTFAGWSQGALRGAEALARDVLKEAGR